MRTGTGAFSPRERRVALLALLAAVLIAALGALVQPLLTPSVGPWGGETSRSAPTPGVLDATPLMG
jgi:hypothetical protein